MLADVDTTTFSLEKAAEDARRARTSRRVLAWGLFLGLCIPAILLVALPAPSPLWVRAVGAAVLVLIGATAVPLTRILQPQLMEPKRIPLDMTISPTGIEIRFQDSPMASYKWDDLSLRLVFLEVKYPDRSPLMWLHFNDESFFRGIRLDRAIYGALIQAATQRQFTNSVTVRALRYPTRELIWTTYSRSPPPEPLPHM